MSEYNILIRSIPKKVLQRRLLCSPQSPGTGELGVVLFNIHRYTIGLHRNMGDIINKKWRPTDPVMLRPELGGQLNKDQLNEVPVELGTS